MHIQQFSLVYQRTSLTYKNVKVKYNKIDKVKPLNTNLKNHFDYYAVPMKSKSEAAINEEAWNTDYIMKQSNYRLLICQLKGVKN